MKLAPRFLKLTETLVRSHKNRLARWMAAALVCCCVNFQRSAQAQAVSDPPEAPTPSAKPKSQPSRPYMQPAEFFPSQASLQSLPRNLFQDQKNFWTAPFHMTAGQWEWSVPVVVAGLGLVASDLNIENHVPTNPST